MRRAGQELTAAHIEFFFTLQQTAAPRRQLLRASEAAACRRSI